MILDLKKHLWHTNVGILAEIKAEQIPMTLQAALRENRRQGLMAVKW